MAHLDHIIDAVLQHPYVQRLRGVSQLGTLCLSIKRPQFSYSRLSHSEGTSHVAARVGRKLEVLTCEQPPSCGERVTAYHTFVLRLASLLHDVGHGPWSHQFDDILTDMYTAYNPDSEDPMPLHEGRGVKLVGYIIRTVVPISMWDRIVEGGVDVIEEQIKSLILGTKSASLPRCMQHVLHSPTTDNLDVDRLDYIPRDASILLFINPSVLAGSVNMAIEGMKLTDGGNGVVFGMYPSRCLIATRALMHTYYYPTTARDNGFIYIAIRAYLTKESISFSEFFRMCRMDTLVDADMFCRLLGESSIIPGLHHGSVIL